MLRSMVLSWYLSDSWLNSFVYRSDINGISFVLAGLFIPAITMVTVSYHTVGSTWVNLAESLRYE